MDGSIIFFSAFQINEQANSLKKKSRDTENCPFLPSSTMPFCLAEGLQGWVDGCIRRGCGRSSLKAGMSAVETSQSFVKVAAFAGVTPCRSLWRGRGQPFCAIRVCWCAAPVCLENQSKLAINWRGGGLVGGAGSWSILCEPCCLLIASPLCEPTKSLRSSVSLGRP